MTETEVRAQLENHAGVHNVKRGGGIHRDVLFVWGHSVSTGWPAHPAAVEDRLDIELGSQTVQWVPGRSGGIMRDPIALTPENLASEAAKLWTPPVKG